MEYKALRRICGAYHGSRHTSLAKIAAMETLNTKLDDIQASWAGRAVCMRDQNIWHILETQHSGDKWHKGHKMFSYGPKVDGLHNPISRAFRLTGTTAEPDELAYGD